jgi:hypothetical protein
MRTLQLILAASALLAGSAFATPISGASGAGAPSVPGATTVLDFDSMGNTTFSSVTFGNVTISGMGGSLRSSNQFAGQYNGRGAYYLDNAQGNTSGFRFDFANTVTAFAFNWGAADDTWTLSAYDASNNLIETMLPTATHGSNSGEYFGLADTGIKYAVLSDASPGDWVFVDNFVVAEASANVPEPASLALFGAAFGAAALVRRRKAKKAA